MAEKVKALMLGPSLESKGGIASVARTLMASELKEEHAVKYIPTTVDGTKLQKVQAALHALLSFRGAIDQYDVVHLHFSYGVSMTRKMPFIRLAHKKGKKVILHCHSSQIEEVIKNGEQAELDKLIRFLLMGDAVVVMSPYWKNLITDNLPIPENSIEVIPNGIEIGQLDGACEAHEGTNILYLGRLEYDKGIDILIQGLADALQGMDEGEISLTLAGLGTQEAVEEYEAMAAQSGIECDFFGWADDEDKKRLMKCTDILALPSRREVFPMVLLEAMSYGVPCIASDCGSIPDIIEDGVSGSLFKTGDVKSFASEVQPLLASEDRRNQYSLAARKSIETKYELSNVVRLCSNLYERVANGR